MPHAEAVLPTSRLIDQLRYTMPEQLAVSYSSDMAFEGGDRAPETVTISCSVPNKIGVRRYSSEQTGEPDEFALLRDGVVVSYDSALQTLFNDLLTAVKAHQQSWRTKVGDLAALASRAIEAGKIPEHAELACLHDRQSGDKYPIFHTPAGEIVFRISNENGGRFGGALMLRAVALQPCNSQPREIIVHNRIIDTECLGPMLSLFVWGPAPDFTKLAVFRPAHPDTLPEL